MDFLMSTVQFPDHETSFRYNTSLEDSSTKWKLPQFAENAVDYHEIKDSLYEPLPAYPIPIEKFGRTSDQVDTMAFLGLGSVLSHSSTNSLKESEFISMEKCKEINSDNVDMHLNSAVWESPFNSNQKLGERKKFALFPVRNTSFGWLDALNQYENEKQD